VRLPTADAPPAGSALPGGPREAVSAVAVAVAAGAVTGLVAAFSYYDQLLRPLAHTFGLGILLAVLASAGQAPRRAALRTSTAAFAAIVTFHLGQQLIYRIKYHGDAYAFSATSLALWGLLALAAGVVLGPVFARIGRSGWSGSAAASSTIGLLAADVRRRTHHYPDDSPTLLTFAVLAVIIVLVLTAVTRRQLVRTALLALPCAILAYFLITTPLLELLPGISR